MHSKEYQDKAMRTNNKTDIKELQKMQKELDDYIIRVNDLAFMDHEHLLSNMFSAAIDELLVEVKEDITNPEEWVDVLHFILSIANKYDFELEEPTLHGTPILEDNLEYAILNLLEAHRLSKCFKHWSDKRPNKSQLKIIKLHLECVIGTIKNSCDKLGTNMVEEYNKKYEINKQRQREGY